MDFDLFDEIIGYLPLKDVVQNVYITSKYLSYVAHYIESNELYDISHVKMNDVQFVTDNWPHLKFEYNVIILNDGSMSKYLLNKSALSKCHTVRFYWIGEGNQGKALIKPREKMS